MSKTIINWTNYDIYLCLEEKRRLIHNDGVTHDCVYVNSKDYFASRLQFGDYTLECSKAVLELIYFFWREWYIDLDIHKNRRVYGNCDDMIVEWLKNSLLECAEGYL